MTSEVIGIQGLIGSGKDTVGKFLISEYGYTRLSFAMVLKDMLAVVFGWDRKMLDGTTPESRAWRDEIDVFWTKKLGRDWTPRIAMQQVGTELFRNQFHDDIWLNTVERKMLEYDKVVFTDVRFPNEIAFVRQNGQLWQVEKGERPDWWLAAEIYNKADEWSKSNMSHDEQTPTSTHDIHESEWAWVGYRPDRIITNNGTLKDLYDAVKSPV